MKFELNRIPRGSSIEVIKDEIRRVAGLIPDTIISKKKFDELSKISTSALSRKFGTWENALNSCDLGYRYSGRSVTDKMRNQHARNFSDYELINELIRVANILEKKELSQSEFNRVSKISASSITRRFGDWSKGLNAAGLNEVKMAKRYTEFDFFENLLNVWTFYGRQPKYREMDLPPSRITSGAYERKWGKWSSALMEFIKYANADKLEKINELVLPVPILTKQTKTPTKDNRDIPLGLRYKVLSRDRFRCIKCGNSPASDLNCKLHIDHIIPFSKGGLTILENLQTTCDNCNLGKGNRYEE